MERPLRIGVIGGGECDAAVGQAARRVGQRIAEAGAVLICGGLGGVMEEAARGAAERGGLTIGILPGDDASSANDGIAVPITTDLGDARNVVIVRSSDAVIAIDGGWGTLSEMAFCLKNSVPLVRLMSDSPDLPAPKVATPDEAVEQALDLAARARRG